MTKAVQHDMKINAAKLTHVLPQEPLRFPERRGSEVEFPMLNAAAEVRGKVRRALLNRQIFSGPICLNSFVRNTTLNSFNSYNSNKHQSFELATWLIISQTQNIDGLNSKL